jgi:neprilysin
LSREFLIKGTEEKLVKAYYNYQVDMAVLYGAEKGEAEKEIKEVLAFEIALANVNFIV